MFSPILTIPALLVAIFIYVSTPDDISFSRRILSIILSVIIFLSFYSYSKYQFNLNWERGRQLYSHLKSYQLKHGKYPSNLSVLSDETQQQIPKIKRGLINTSFTYKTNQKDRFEISMDYGFAPDKCHWYTDNGWDCNF